MNRNARVQLAEETVRILDDGHYVSRGGAAVDIGSCLQVSVAETRTIRPEEWDDIIAAARRNRPAVGAGTIEVTPETTLAAIERLVVADRCPNVVALNFASAKNPGGGFLGGSQAQEESLARSSGLYATLLPQKAYYSANRAHGSLLYTDHAILSPAVPVCRNDSGDLLEQPYPATFITMPAVNIGAMAADSVDRHRVEAVMRRRIDCVFALAASTGSRHMALGAWGCGVFRNEPGMIASLFAERLAGPSSWRSFFDRIVFAVFDAKDPAVNRLPFETHLAAL